MPAIKGKNQYFALDNTIGQLTLITEIFIGSDADLERKSLEKGRIDIIPQAQNFTKLFDTAAATC